MRYIVFLGLAFILIGCRYNRCIPCEIKEIAKKQEMEKTDPKKKESTEYALRKNKKLQVLREQLNYTPLFEIWYHALENEHIRQLYVCEEMVFAETDSKRLFAFDRNSGIPQWIYTVGDSLDFKPVVYKDEIYLIGMAKLHIVDRATGNLLVKKAFDFIPSSPLCVTENYIYLGAWDNFLYTLERKKGDFEWRYRIDGHILGTPVMMDGSLFFPGTDQRVYSINANHGSTSKEWSQEGRYETLSPNVSGVVAQSDPPVVYFGSRDYNLYSLNRVTGILRWKFESGGEIEQSPYLLGKNIYVVSRKLKNDSTLYALESGNGDMKWSVEHATSLFFIGKEYHWILKNDQKLVAVKNEQPTMRKLFNVEIGRAHV